MALLARREDSRRLSTSRSSLHGKWFGAAHEGLPRPELAGAQAHGKSAILIHAFSGRGQEMYSFSSMPCSRNRRAIFTVSLDIIIDEEFGDVSRESVRAFRLWGVRERAVIGVLASLRNVVPGAG